MKHISNEEKAKEIADKYYKMFDDCTLATGVEKGAIEMAQWKDEQFIEEKKEIDEQWKRLMAESKSIGVDLMQRKEEQYKQEKQQWIEKACDFFYDELNNGNMDCSDIECFIKKFKKNINYG